MHIRKGVYFHDKPPVNGREMTPYDVEYSYHRNLAMGEFSEAEPTPGLNFNGWDTIPIESITATDKWTVVFKLKEPDARALRAILDPMLHLIFPREVIEKYGDMKDWRNLVGTGPWMLTEYVEDSSLTYTKNPNYWGYDEKFPENRLPYIDELRVPIMLDGATRIAALRTGKIDYLGVFAHAGTFDSIDKVKSMQRTNPEIVLTEHVIRSDHGIGMNTQRPPFDDIRVRKAMNMALDRETLHDTYFKGWGTWTPHGRINSSTPVGGIPFEEWPEEVKKGYMYDPAGAEALLDEAGYPRGADGIRFKTSVTFGEWASPDYPELLAATYYRDIGVDVEVEVHSGAEHQPIKTARDFDMIYTVLGTMDTYATPYLLMACFKTGDPDGIANTNDPVYDAMYAAAAKVSTEEEQLPLVRELNMYAIERYWVVPGQSLPRISAHQPWVKGWNGELSMGAGVFDYAIAARLWIDSELKKAMGH